MTTKPLFAFALFLDKTDACAAVEALTQAGYPSERISLRLPPELEIDEVSFRRRTSIHLAGAGAVVGALVGAAIWGLAGFNAATFHVIESSMFAGPVSGILASVIAGGGLAGIIGSIDTIGQPKCVVHGFQNRVRNQGYFLSVECQGLDHKRNAEMILKHAGAEDVSCASETRGFRA